MLLALLLFLRETPLLGRGLDIAAICGLTVLALLTKESAIALPVLAAIAAVPGWRRNAAWRRKVVLLIGIAAAAASYLVWRLLEGLAVSGTAALTRYIVKEQISRTFGTLAVPFMAATIEVHPFAAILLTGGIIALGAWALTAKSRLSSGHVVAMQGLAWCLVAAAPTMGFLMVGAFLDGTRYLYLSALGWGWVLGGMLDVVSNDRYARRIAWVSSRYWGWPSPCSSSARCRTGGKRHGNAM